MLFSSEPNKMFSYALILVLVSFANAEPRFPNDRIIGGQTTVIETYPYQVSIQQFGMHTCGGSIISENYILTAGHCADSKFLVTIRAGTSTKSFGGSTHRISKIIRHENFKINSNGVPLNDIALIKVHPSFKFDDTRQPIDLFNIGEETTPGVNGTITGWGTTGKGWVTAMQLQTVNIPILEKNVCNTAYEEMGGIPDGQICAAYYGVGGKDACQGDSGGPLAVDGRLAGVVSWGNGCAQPKYPGVYTEVAHYREWIDKHIEP